ncbi:MAG: alanyl-tRNA editing protein, partial [Acutalibacteraceae bacterium]
MTEKLYDKDSHIKEFSATVLTCRKSGENYAVILNKTAFFPEGGGQESDRGAIGGAAVSDVQIIDNEIIHFTDRPLEVGKEYDCRLDWERRFRNMQNHSGEHIVSGLTHKLFGLNNVGFHLGAEMTVDFDGLLSREQLSEIERLANKAVWENVPIRAYYPDDDELESLNYRSKLELTENVRIVDIEGYDLCACCAPHVEKTGEIGLIKILDSFKNKGGVRVFIKCGTDALQDYNDKYSNVQKISNLLSVKQNEAAAAVDRLSDENRELKFEASSLKKRLIAAKAETFAPDSDKTAVFEDNLDIKELQLFADALYKKSGGIRGVFSGEDGNFSFAICGEETALDSFFKSFKERFSVRGGGRNGMVQGTVIGEKAEIESF